jgi:ribosomal protein L12E/L44/L45/RPP1/RPP2
MKEVLTAGGVKVDDGKVKKIVESCKGKDVLKVLHLILKYKVCKEALKSAPKVSSSPVKEDKPKKEEKGGKKDEKKPEKKVEEVPAAEDDMPLDLFG